MSIRVLPSLPVRPEAVAGPLWSAFRELERTQWLDPAQHERRQLSRFRALLTHVLRHVPYYGEALAGLNPADVRSLDDVRRLPILTRRTYQQRYPEMVARQLPPGERPAGKGRTSGTSGIPIEVLQTNKVQFWWHAFLLRDLHWCGFDPRGRMASIRYTGKTGEEKQRLLAGVAQPGWGPTIDPVLQTGPSFVMDIAQDSSVQLAWLQAVEPNYLTSYPSNLLLLAGLIEKHGRRVPGLRAIQSISESLTPEYQARIETVWGVPVKNTYSCVEAGYLASPCPDATGYHVHAENVLLEVLDAEGTACAPGQTGRVVLTTLHNYQTPFVRYEILDEAEVGPSCPCGRGLPLLTRIHGKQKPPFRLPNGKTKRSGPWPPALSQLGGCRQFQIIQRAIDHVVFRIVPDGTWNEEKRQTLERLAVEFFEAPIRVDIELLERIPSATGKVVDCVSELV